MGKLAWYVARGGGLTAWLLLSTTVVLGLLTASRILGRRVSRAQLEHVHRIVGEVAMIFVGVHILGLFLDTYVHFGLTDLFVPLASSWHPIPVAFGIVAFWLLIAVMITSLLKDRIPHALWQTIHLSSYAAYVLTTVHLLSAGTDATWGPIAITNIAIASSVAVLAGIALVRYLRRPARVIPARPQTRAAPKVAVGGSPQV